MTEVDLAQALSSLDEHAKKLNELTDKINDGIQRIQDRLSRAKIGLEVWFNDPLYQSDSSGDLGPHTTTTWTSDLLGYARIDGDWCLAVKTMHYVSGFFEGDVSSPFTNEYLDEGPKPLLRASRHLRLAAFRVMPDFLEFLTATVRATVADLERASKLAQ